MGPIGTTFLRTRERLEKLRFDRRLLIDGVQAAKIVHSIIGDRYAKGTATLQEFVQARENLAEAESALRAHEEVYGKPL
jgi:hypothetical protein